MMKNRELYFENVSDIGNLYLDHVFFEFEDEPILFTCISDINELYLCLCSEMRYEQRWLISRCSIETLRALVKESIDVRTALCIPEKVVVVCMDLQCEETSSIRKVKEIDELDLPEAGTFLWKNEEANNNYLWKREFFERFSEKKQGLTYSQEGTPQTYREVLVNQLIVDGVSMDHYTSSFHRLLQQDLERAKTMLQSIMVSRQSYNTSSWDYSEMRVVTISEDDDWTEAA